MVFFLPKPIRTGRFFVRFALWHLSEAAYRNVRMNINNALKSK